MAEETGLTTKSEEELTDGKINPDETTEETEQIREQIEETRHKMGETIDAIQEKLSFENISEEVSEQVSEQAAKLFKTAKNSVYHATVGKAGEIMSNLNKELKNSDFINKAAAHPFPLFLIGLGAGLLFFGNNKKKSRSLNFRNNRRLYRSSETEGENKSSMIKNVAGAASSAYESAGNAASSAYENVSGAAENAIKRVGDLGTQAQERYEHYIDENPLAVGAVAFAVGAGIGLALPSTRYENELAGPVRDKMMSRVKDSVNETISKVKNAADEAITPK